MKSCLLPTLCMSALPMLAQLPAPNAAGVSAGHDIMIVKDLEGANKFWSALGGEPTALAQLKLTKLPGVLYLMRMGDNKGGTEGSSVEYLGYKVKNLKETLAHQVKDARSEEHTSELQSQFHLVCRLLLEKKKKKT